MADVEITVRGSHRVETPPERATVRWRVMRDGPDVEQVVADVAGLAEQMRSSIAVLHAGDGPVVSWSSERLQTWASRPWNQEGKQLPLVHSAQVGFDAEFADFAALGRWLTDVVTIDGVTVDGVDWALTEEHRDRLLPEARTAAVADARAKAEVYAASLGLHRLIVIAVADAGMLGTGPSPLAGSEGIGMARMALAARGPDVEFAPRPITVVADVDARFVAS